MNNNVVHYIRLPDVSYPSEEQLKLNIWWDVHMWYAIGMITNLEILIICTVTVCVECIHREQIKNEKHSFDRMTNAKTFIYFSLFFSLDVGPNRRNFRRVCHLCTQVTMYTSTLIHVFEIIMITTEYIFHRLKQVRSGEKNFRWILIVKLSCHSNDAVMRSRWQYHPLSDKQQKKKGLL